MRASQRHNITFGFFFSIVMVFLIGSYQNVYGQVTSGVPITSSTTWTVPAGVTTVEVQVWGAGGSGAGHTGNGGAGAGGGGGYSHTLSIPVTPGNTYTINVGVGGVGNGGAGSNGGDTWFISTGTIIAYGGVGGNSGAGGTGGAGGALGIGDTTYSGGAGGAGNSSKNGGGGAGGSSAGTAANGVAGGDGAGGGAGIPGTAPTGAGAGGAGGDKNSGGASGSVPGGGGGGAGNGNGGNGANGQVILTFTPTAGCNLSASGLTNITCNDNGTPSITSDDTFTFDLNPTGTSLGATYNITGDITDSGTYGSATTFGPYPISGGNLNITITDVDDGTCQIAETVTAPAPCSVPICTLTASGLANITCDDNGTPSITGDDTFTFELNPTGTDLGASYNVTGDVNQSGNSYGSATTFGPYPISGGNLSITITDVSGNCSVGETVTAPAPCSVACDIQSAGLSNIFCDDKGTLSDSSDDTFTFTLNPTGTGLSGTYNVSGDITRNGIAYGADELFGPYLISSGDKTITITDASGGSCEIVDLVVSAPGSCSHSFTECSSCHITHSAPGLGLTNVAGNALLCQSCHTSLGLASEKPLVDGSKATPGVGGNSHSWDVPADNSTYQTTVPAADSEMGKRLPDGNIICSTCHNQHNNGNAGSAYLRIDNSGDSMCKVCHDVRDVQRFIDGAANKGSHPVGITYDGGNPKYNASPSNTEIIGGKVECSSCHGVHDVANSGALTTDGNLLKATNDNNLCKDCHAYNVTHNSFDCLDCHEVHNTVDGVIGNNIFMIKDRITVTTPAPASASIDATVVFLAESGANSFVDKDGTYDGICEVCHTATVKHTNTGGSLIHDDASDKRETNCVGCHFHNVGFETPSGPQTCVSCHSSATSGGRGGTAQIVGTGGEMDNTLPSRHTSSGLGVDPDTTECEACHYESVGDHPTGTMMLEDPENLNTVFSGSDKDVYCIGCHDGAPPAGWPFPGNDPKYDKSNYISTPHDTGNDTCLLCHETHGSQYSNLTKFATNYESCNDCHDGSPASTTINAADIAVPGSNGTQHAFNVAANSGLYQSNSPSDTNMSSRLESGNIVCSTCHDPHDNTNGSLLVSQNNTDQMCKDCHTARAKGRFTDDIVNNKGSHPVGLTYVAGGDYMDPAPTLSATQFGLVSGNIECSSCHAVHNATTTDGNLLREPMTNAACKECHNYKPHRGFDCLDCHQSHNVTNIMLVKSTVNGSPVVFDSQGTTASPVQAAAKSFADGDSTYDGICEVCHDPAYDASPLNYHRSDGTGASHNEGKDCTGCHAHNDATESFPQGSCHSCHETPDEYPTTGAHAIHSGAPYYFACSTCHFEYGEGGANEPTHASGTINVAFDLNSIVTRFYEDINSGYIDASGANAPTYNPVDKTCSNIYCHSNGMSADRGTDFNDPALGFGPVNDHNWGGGTTNPPLPFTGTAERLTYHVTPGWDNAGSIPMCSGCHPGVGNKTAPYDITPGGAYEVKDPPTNTNEQQPGTGQHGPIKSAHQNNSNLDGWSAVQCFWCHDVDTRSGNGTAKKQGTYGTTFHIDGQTRFKVGFVGDGQGGTFVQEIGGNRGRGEVGGHCNNQTCWD